MSFSLEPPAFIISRSAGPPYPVFLNVEEGLLVSQFEAPDQDGTTFQFQVLLNVRIASDPETQEAHAAEHPPEPDEPLFSILPAERFERLDDEKPALRVSLLAETTRAGG